MIPQLDKLSKTEILWLSRNTCKHRHSYLQHFSCLAAEKAKHEKIGILDIEASGLRADFGYVFSYAIKDFDGKIHGRTLTPDEIRDGTYDKNLVKEFIDMCSNYERFVTFFGTWYDLPFLRTRALYWGHKFPEYDSIRHTDLWMVIKKKFKLRNNRLQTACDFFDIKSKGHPMKPRQWWEANTGNKKALDYIWTHNIEDVISTEKLYKKVTGQFKEMQTSI